MHHKNNFRGGQGKRNIHDYNDYQMMIDYNDCNDYQSLRVYPDKGSCVTGLFISKHLRSSLIIIEMSAMCVLTLHEILMIIMKVLQESSMNIAKGIF